MRPLDDGFLELAREQADRDYLLDSAYEDHQAHAAYDRRQARAALAAWDRAVAAWRESVFNRNAQWEDIRRVLSASSQWTSLTGLVGPTRVAIGL